MAKKKTEIHLPGDNTLEDVGKSLREQTILTDEEINEICDRWEEEINEWLESLPDEKT